MPVHTATLIDGVEEYCDLIQDYCQEHFLLTNLMQTLLHSVRSGQSHFDRCFWWILKRHENDSCPNESNYTSVCGVAMRTGPWGYSLHCTDLKALQPLAEKVIEVESLLAHGCQLFPFVRGEKETTLHFQAMYEDLYSKRYSLNPPVARIAKKAECELLYALKSFNPPPIQESSPPMQVVTAKQEDTDLIISWLTTFVQETGASIPNLTDVVQSRIKSHLYRILVVNGAQVSLGGRTDTVGEQSKLARIGPIFTPAEFRSQGYATFMTACLIQEILDLGATPVLYTQEQNQASNRVYQKLGFELVQEDIKLLY